MNNEQLALLELVKISQFGFFEELNWENVDMDALYNEASLQSVLGIVSPEIPSEKCDAKWKEAMFRCKASYIRYCHFEDDLKTLFDDADIPFIVLKGNSAAISYTIPSHRTMGDIDFIVPQNCFDRAREHLISSGYVEGHENSRHIAFTKDGMSYELHRRYSHEDINLENYIIDGLKTPVRAVIDGHEFPMLPKLANGLILLDHMRNHLKRSLGLRQVIDWMMYVYRNLDDDFWNSEFKAVVEEKKMYTLAITATRMCQIYLGLPETITWCKTADEEVCEQLMENLLDSGNFGHKHGKGYSVEFATTNIKRKGLFRWLQHAGEHNWKSYHKHHWLKPFCWLYQFFRYFKQVIKTGRSGKQLKADFDRSNERYELLKKLNIS